LVKAVRRAIRILFGASLLLLVASFATCYFGVDYAVRQRFPEGVPPGQDTDFLGLGWVVRGMVLMLVAVVAGLAALVLRSVRRDRNRGSEGHGGGAI
jgi:TRAP-type C4-dicarboxylate transport system permease small subunit